MQEQQEHNGGVGSQGGGHQTRPCRTDATGGPGTGIGSVPGCSSALMTDLLAHPFKGLGTSRQRATRTAQDFAAVHESLRWVYRELMARGYVSAAVQLVSPNGDPACAAMQMGALEFVNDIINFQQDRDPAHNAPDLALKGHLSLSGGPY